MRIGLMWRVLPFYVVIGSILAIPFLQRQAQAEKVEYSTMLAQTRLAFSDTNRPAFVHGTPVQIIIPDLAIDLKIVTGGYVASQGTWTVSDSDANYAANSAQLNNRTNKTLIYGHANSRVFKSTEKLLPGAIAYVTAESGTVFKYVFKSKTVVDPTNVGELKTLKGKPGLVLLSCDGLFNQDRRFMYFDLVEAS